MNRAGPAAADVCAAIVLYHAPGTAVQMVRDIEPEVGCVLLIDNGGSEAVLQSLRAYPLTVIRNDVNRGIAGALNQACRFAEAHGYSRLLTLDGDSRPKPGMVSALLQAVASDIAIVAPLTLDDARDLAAQRMVPPRPYEVEWVHTSGNLLRLEAVRAAGPFREDFVVDAVDYEMCRRLRCLGYRIVIVPDAVQIQTFGSPRTVRVRGRPVICRNYNPTRRYYQARNGLLLARSSRSLAHLRRHLDYTLREAAKVLLFEDGKRDKLAATGRGLYHGVIGRSGPIVVSDGDGKVTPN